MMMRELRDGFVEQGNLWEVCLLDLTVEAQAGVVADWRHSLFEDEKPRIVAPGLMVRLDDVGF